MLLEEVAQWPRAPVKLDKESLITRSKCAYCDVELKSECFSFVFLQLERKPTRCACPSHSPPPRPGPGCLVVAYQCFPCRPWQCHSVTGALIKAKGRICALIGIHSRGVLFIPFVSEPALFLPEVVAAGTPALLPSHLVTQLPEEHRLGTAYW